MRAAVAVLSFVLCGCGFGSSTAPSRPSVQISIPEAPGWSYSDHDSALIEAFQELMEERMDTSGGAIASAAFQKTKEHRLILTLIGDQPEQIVSITLPLLRASHLPSGTTVTKFTGEHGETGKPIDL